MRKELVLIIRGLAEVYDKTITDELCEIWQKALSDLTIDELNRAVKIYMLDPGSIFFPRPGQLYGLARPEEDVEDKAILIVDQIFNLLGPCGGDDIGIARAKAKLCEIGWAYITNLGGWGKFSNDMKYAEMEDAPIMKSQARRSIRALINRKKNDMDLLPEAPLLSLSSFGIAMKTIDKGSEADAYSETDRNGTQDD